MADQWQLALLKSSVEEWNAWREAHPDVKVDLSGADLSNVLLIYITLRDHVVGINLCRADLRYTNFSGATLYYPLLAHSNLSHADFRHARLILADFSFADLSFANLIGAGLNGALLTGSRLSFANLAGADLTRADLEGTDLTGVKGLPKGVRSKPHPVQPPSTINWLRLVETAGENLFSVAVGLAAIIQGLDVVERRWRERKKKQQSSSASSTAKTPSPESEIVEILLVMDDGSNHTFKRWVSDPDELRKYIDAFSDPSSKIKPLQVVFRKREGRALVVDATKGTKDNKPLDVILGYLDADPQ